MYKEGTKPSGLLCLKQGSVKLSRLGVEGNEYITALKKPIDFIGYKSIMAEQLHSNTATAIEDCEVCVINKSDFVSILKSNSELSLRLLKSFATELIATDRRTVNLTQKHMRGRMAEALIMLKDTYGLKEDKETINVELKRSEYAAMSNMTTSNAIKVLSGFAKENIIALEQRKVLIKDLTRLRKISELNI